MENGEIYRKADGRLAIRMRLPDEIFAKLPVGKPRDWDRGDAIEAHGVDVIRAYARGEIEPILLGIANRPWALALALEWKRQLADEKSAAAQRLAENVPGIFELQAAIDAEEEYREAFTRMMDDGDNDGVNPPAIPKSNLAALRAQFPRAAQWIKASAYSRAAHHDKCAAGKRAMELLENGGEIGAVDEIMNNWVENPYFD